MEYREILQRISVAERHVPLGLQSLGFYHILYGPHGFSPKKNCIHVVLLLLWLIDEELIYAWKIRVISKKSAIQNSQITFKPKLACIFLPARAKWNITFCIGTPCMTSHLIYKDADINRITTVHLHKGKLFGGWPDLIPTSWGYDRIRLSEYRYVLQTYCLDGPVCNEIVVFDPSI